MGRVLDSFTASANRLGKSGDGSDYGGFGDQDIAYVELPQRSEQPTPRLHCLLLAVHAS